MSNKTDNANYSYRRYSDAHISGKDKTERHQSSGDVLSPA